VRAGPRITVRAMNDFEAGLSHKIKERIRDVPDFPKPGIMFKDLTPVFAHGPSMSAIQGALAARYKDRRIDAFVGIEARGFIVAAPTAAALAKGLIILRKPGKLPWEKVSLTYDLEYGSDTLEMHRDAVSAGMRLVVMDDLLATGGTMRAAVELLKKHGAEVVEAAFIVELGFLKGRSKLDVPCAALVSYE
jgi:adenine phosphoribosyltransferase